MNLDNTVAFVVMLSSVCLLATIALIVGLIIAIDSPYILPSSRDSQKSTPGEEHA
ncbi:MAG: hypothetical protein QM758_03955 [Armatimonas sp.]